MTELPVSLDTRVQIPDLVVHQGVGEESVLLNLDTGFYYGLDEVGSRAWELLAEEGSLRAVYDTMLAEYSVDPAELESDLVRLAQELQEMGLVEIVT